MWKCWVSFNKNYGEYIHFNSDPEVNMNGQIDLKASIGHALQCFLHTNKEEELLPYLNKYGIASITFDYNYHKKELTNHVNNFYSGKYHTHDVNGWVPDAVLKNISLRISKTSVKTPSQIKRLSGYYNKAMEAFENPKEFIEQFNTNGELKNNKYEEFMRKWQALHSKTAGITFEYVVSSFVELLYIELYYCLVNGYMPKKCKNNKCNSFVFNSKNSSCEGCKIFGYKGKTPLSKLPKDNNESTKEGLKRLFRVNKSRYKWSIEDAKKYLSNNEKYTEYINEIDALWPNRAYNKKKKPNKHVP